MLGPVKLKVCMPIDSQYTEVPFENELCHIFKMAAYCVFKMADLVLSTYMYICSGITLDPD
jgi:hypothetical protein